LQNLATSLDSEHSGESLVAQVDGYPGDQLRTLAQDLQRRGRKIVVLVGISEEKVALVVATDGSLDAVSTVKTLAAYVGGGGGGSKDLALAGGRDAAGIPRVLAAASDLS
jgi:alanyl-tRNA synthetase